MAEPLSQRLPRARRPSFVIAESSEHRYAAISRSSCRRTLPPTGYLRSSFSLRWISRSDRIANRSRIVEGRCQTSLRNKIQLSALLLSHPPRFFPHLRLTPPFPCNLYLQLSSFHASGDTRSIFSLSGSVIQTKTLANTAVSTLGTISLRR